MGLLLRAKFLAIAAVALSFASGPALTACLCRMTAK
jgi:hypothetical protein